MRGRFTLINARFLCIALICAFVAPFVTHAQDFSSTNFTVTAPTISSGEYSTSDSYTLLSVISDFALGTSTTDNFGINPGFLFYPFVSTPTVTATAGDAQVALSWTAASGVLGWTVGGYDVGQSTTSGGPYSYSSVGNVTSSTRTGLTNGTTYYFVVLPKENVSDTRIATSTEVSAIPAASGSGDDTVSSGGGGGGSAIASLIRSLFVPRISISNKVDLNGDGRVDIIDLSILLYYYNTQDTNEDAKKGDFDGDGEITIKDISILFYYWSPRV